MLFGAIFTSTFVRLVRDLVTTDKINSLPDYLCQNCDPKVSTNKNGLPVKPANFVVLKIKQMENQDRLTQELIDYLIKHSNITSKDYRIEKNISGNDWSQVKKVALERDYMIPGGSEDSYFITPKGKGYGENRYIEEIQKERTEERIRNKKTHDQDEKLALDLIYIRRQVKLFWPILAVSLIINVCTVITLVLKFQEKPIIQKQYIPVDSHGKTYNNEIPNK